MASSNVLELTDGNFEQEVIGSDLPVLVDVWAPWCAPCRMVGPVVDELADEFAGRVKVGKLNADDHPQRPAEFAIQAIPTLLLFKGGRVVSRIVGVRPKQEIAEALTKVA